MVNVAPVIKRVRIRIRPVKRHRARTNVRRRREYVSLITLNVRVRQVNHYRVLSLVSLPNGSTVVINACLRNDCLTRLRRASDLRTVATARIMITICRVVVVNRASARRSAVRRSALLGPNRVTRLERTMSSTEARENYLKCTMERRANAVLRQLQVMVIRILRSARLRLHTLTRLRQCAPRSSRGVRANGRELITTRTRDNVRYRMIM